MEEIEEEEEEYLEFKEMKRPGKIRQLFPEFVHEGMFEVLY